jgi:hypothetical protein
MRSTILIVAALCASGRASADPALARVLTAPTAWIPRSGTAVGTAGLDHRGKGSIDVAYGLGGLASIQLGLDTDVRACAGCMTPTPAWLGRALFRLGARSDLWFHGQPAVAIGMRTTFAGTASGLTAPQVADAFVVASRTLGPVELHVGVDALDARADGHRMTAQLRPMAGLEWTPAQFPQTTLLGDVAWEPRLEPVGPHLEWLAGWGVRYAALSWGSIELAVRHREREGLAGSTVLVRVNGVWSR